MKGGEEERKGREGRDREWEGPPLRKFQDLPLQKLPYFSAHLMVEL